MKIMLDTNVLISALMFGGKTQELLERLVISNHEILVSEYVRSEFCAIVRQKWVDKAERIITLFERMDFSFCKSVDVALGTVRDKKDIPVLSDAIFNKADVLLTGDKDFLESNIKRPLIYSPAMMRDFLGIA